MTIDAMGCHRAIAKQIVEQGGDDLLALKGNPSKLAEEVETLFSEAERVGYEGFDVDLRETKERGHGRHETRRDWSAACQGLLRNAKPWAQLPMIGTVESERTVNATPTIEHRYYVGSIENHARVLAHGGRGHWRVENGRHWSLDVAFREDASCVRKGYGPENFVLLRHIALNAVKREQSAKLGVKNKRL